jgi:hypothetical protein
VSKRQANMITWLVLFPLTLVKWAQFLPPCIFGCARVKTTLLPSSPPNEIKSYTVCSIAGPMLGSRGPADL